MRKGLICLAGILCILLFAAGCERKGSNRNSEYVVYYVSEKGMKLAAEEFEPKGSSREEILEELLIALQKDYSKESRSIFPEKIRIQKYEWKENQLTVYFDERYNNMKKSQEVLLRAGLVRTVTQVEGIQYVSFMIENVPLADSSGNPVGIMSADTFVENEASSYQETTLTLYFANETGDKLVETRRDVYYKGTSSMEKVILEQLIAGPEEGGRPTIPANTKILNTAVEDGVCYVNLSNEFLSSDYDVVAQIPIYSIVNSLSELSGVAKVQISVNGETSKSFREMISLEEPFERNLDLVENPGKSE